MTRRPVFIAMIALGAMTLAASAYSALSIVGLAPMDRPIFLGWFVAANTTASTFLFLFWKRRHLFGIQAQLVALLWGVLAFWYWLPSPLCHVLSINLDPLQLKWVAFAYLWEVVIAGGLWVLVCLRIFRPLQAFVQGERNSANALRLYQAALHFPIIASGLLAIVTVIAFGIGIAQLWYFAFQSPIELAKTWLIGIISGSFHGLLSYLGIDLLLGPLRVRIEQSYALAGVAKRKLSQRLLGITLVIAASSLTLLSLFVTQSFQLIIKEQVTAQIRADLAQISARVQAASALADVEPLLRGLRRGTHGDVRLINAGEGLPLAEVSPETRRFMISERTGIIEDLKHELKLVAVMEAPKLGKQVVAITRLSDFYEPLTIPARYIAMAALMIVILAAGILTFVSLSLANAIRRLSLAVQQAAAGKAPYTMHLDTADELEDLSHAFAYFIEESRGLHARLEENLAEMEDLLRVVSHDLRAPLINIQGFSKRLEPIMQETVRTLDQVAAHHPAGGLRAQVEAVRTQVQTQFTQSVQFISKSIEKMDALLTGLLCISRIGRKADPVQPNDLNTILDEALVLFAHQLTERAIQVIRHPLPDHVPCRRNEINQVFSNLLSNAIKYMGSPAHPCIEIGATSHRDHVECFVRDTGIGISPPDQRNIFQMFTRLYAIDVPGDGIGLAFVRKILRSHGGTIWVVSEPGRGSTFFFTLPTHPAGSV
jgi:signal transduction histidine kinase